MKTRIKNISFTLMAVIGIMAVVTLGIFAVAALVGGGAYLAMAAGMVPEETVTTTVAKAESPNLLRPDISKQITKIMPSSAPLDTLIREAGAHEATKSTTFKFYSSELRPFQDELDATFTLGPEAASYDLVVKSIHMWQKDDGLLIHGVNGSDGLPLVAHVINVNRSTSTITVVFLNGSNPTNTSYGVGTKPPASILDETKIGRLGNAKAELDANTDPYGHIPTDRFNYVQYHMAAVEESIWQKMSAKEVNWDIRDMQNLQLFDLRCQMEATSWFGVRKEVFDPVRNVTKLHSGGVIRFIEKQIELPASNNTTGWDAWFATATKRIFTGNAGSDTRYLFVGSDLNERLMQVTHIQKQIDGKSTDFKFGLTFRKIETNFGVLLMKHHEGFNTKGFANAGVVVDMNNIRKRVFEPMKVREIDLMSSGIRKAKAYVIEETFGLEVRYADTHALLLPPAHGDLS
jgi:hypothetical protein